MLQDIHFAGVLIIFVIILLIWLAIRSGQRERKNQARIADALEEIAKKEQNESDKK